MKSITRSFFCVVWLLCMNPIMGWAFSPSDTNRILVVYRSNFTGDNDGNGVQDSLQITLHYANWRGIPTNNLFGLAISNNYANTHAEFYNQIVLPLRAKLNTLGQTNIDVILLVYGIPANTPGYTSSICVDNCLMSPFAIPSTTTYSYYYGSYYNFLNNTYMEAAPTFGTDRAHFSHDAYRCSCDSSHMYMVCRLDPRDSSGAPWLTISQLEQMRYAEKYVSTSQYSGVCYVDSRYAYYTDAQLSNDIDVINGNFNEYNPADKNIAYAEHYLAAKHLPFGWERSGTVIGRSGAEIAHATNAWLHGGWYHGYWSVGYGYTDAYDWMPGSVSCDLNSQSASYVHSEQQWLEQAFKRGLSAGVGVINEPYVYGHQRPNILLYYLLEGYTFAESATLATPMLFWQCMNLGDPLYAPFRPKTVTPDTTTPTMAPGFPYIGRTNLTSATIIFQLNISTTEPEVARCVLHYGPTPACTQSNTSLQGYWVRNSFSVTGLVSSSLYYYYMTLTDLAGNTTNSEVKSFRTLNTPPTAEFTANLWTGRAPVSVTFDGTPSTDPDGTVSQWYWSFSDGGSGTGAVVEHTFTNLGISTVTLRIADDQGAGATNRHTVWVEPFSGCMAMLQYGLQGYTNTWDTHISCYNAGELNANYGAAQTAITLSMNTRRGLVRFELPSLPPGAMVDSAELRLSMAWKGYGNSSVIWGLYRVTNDWVEGSGNGNTTGIGAIWNDYDRGHPWATPGGDFDPTPLATINYDNISSYTIFDVKSTVLDWMNGLYPNYGFLLKNSAGNAEIDYYTSECSDWTKRPQLLIFYHLDESFGIEVSASDHGTVTPSGTVSVVAGSNLTVSMTAAPYYHIADVRTNGHSVGGTYVTGFLASATYTWSNICHTGHIEVVFEPNGLSATPSTWDVTIPYDSAPIEQLFLLSNRCDFALSYTSSVQYAENATPWFQCQPASQVVEAGASHLHTGRVSAAGLNVGQYNATCRLTATTASMPPASVHITLTVQPAGQGISFTAPCDQITTNRLDLSATSGSGLPVSFSVFSGPAILSQGTHLSFTGPGQVTLIASQAGNTNWLPAPTVTNVFNVSKARQAITNVSPLSGMIFVETNHVQFSASASSGLPVSFSVLSGPAQISDQTNLTFTSHGYVRILCTQTGDANWVAAPALTNEYRSLGLFSVTMESPHGNGHPISESHTYVEGTLLTHQMDPLDTQGTTQFMLAGWSLQGHNPATGSDSSFAMTLTNHVTIHWLWITNYWLDIEAGSHGLANLSDGWQPYGAMITLTATPDSYYHFSMWSGSDTSTDNPLVFTLTSPKQLTALFAENVTSNTATPEIWLSEHGFTNDFEAAALCDEDGDGISTADEYTADTNPTNRDSCLQLAFNGAGMIHWRGGVQAIQYLEYSSDLSSNHWTLLRTNEPPTATEMQISIDRFESNTYYRLRVMRH